MNLSRERDVCDAFHQAAYHPDIYPLEWMTAMKVALLIEKPLDRRKVVAAISTATMRYNRRVKALAIVSEDQVDALCDDIRAKASGCMKYDMGHRERERVLRLVAARFTHRREDIESAVEDADNIIKKSSRNFEVCKV